MVFSLLLFYLNISVIESLMILSGNSPVAFLAPQMQDYLLAGILSFH